MNLNTMDRNLIEFCKDSIKSVGEIARYLRIAPKNVSVRLKKLEDMKLIEVQKGGLGKKTFVKTINTREKKKIDNKELILKILDYIIKNQQDKNAVMEWGLHIQFKDYNWVEFTKALNFLKINDMLGLVVVESGEKFLKENSNEKKN